MKKIFTKLTVLMIALITALSCSACSLFIEDNKTAGGSKPSTLPDSVTLSSSVVFDTYESEERENSLVSAVSKVSRSVVAISVTTASGSVYGSGVLVDIKTQDEDGKIIENENEFYILTCHHVISDLGEITVYVPDRNGRNNGDSSYDSSFAFKGTIDNKIHTDKAITLIGGDKDTDVAVLKLDIEGNLGGITPADIIPAKVPAPEYKTVLGETVIALGNPSGQLPGTVSSGLISYLDREVNISDIGNMTLFQHVSSIDHGSSGGGLFNLYGELIGITNAGNDAYNNIFYAIPYKNLTTEKDNGFITIAKQLICSKTETNYGYISGRWMLGITIVERTDQFGSSYVSVSEVVAGSNAEAAGLMVGDILTAVTYLDENGEKVIMNVTGNNSFSGVISAIKKHYTIGDAFTISIKRLEGRQFKYYDKEITLAKQLIFGDTGN